MANLKQQIIHAPTSSVNMKSKEQSILVILSVPAMQYVYTVKLSSNIRALLLTNRYIHSAQISLISCVTLKEVLKLSSHICKPSKLLRRHGGEVGGLPRSTDSKVNRTWRLQHFQTATQKLQWDLSLGLFKSLCISKFPFSPQVGILDFWQSYKFTKRIH